MNLDHEQQRLLAAALDVQAQAFAPYSGFHVGASLLTEQDQLFVGCNVENASYGLSMCAERNAVAAMIAAGARQIRAIAVASSGGVTPCGACRQVLAEFGEDFPVLLVDSRSGKLVTQWSLAKLLPGTFRFPPPSASR